MTTRLTRATYPNRACSAMCFRIRALAGSNRPSAPTGIRVCDSLRAEARYHRVRMRVVSLTPLSIGLVEWRALETVQTLVAKVTFELGPGGRVVPSRFQAPLALDTPHGEDATALRIGSDFAPFKRDVDVLVAGRAYGQTPATLHWCGLGVDGFYKRFAAVSPDARPSIPLLPSRVRADPYGPPVPHDVGPRPFASGPAGNYAHPKGLVQTRLPADCPAEWFNVAALDQRIPGLSPTATLTLDGLVEGGGRWSYGLPGLEPRILAVPARAGPEPREVQPRADTLVVDGERKLVFITFRADLPDDFPILQLVAHLAPRGTILDWTRLVAEAPNAKTSEAVDPFSLLADGRRPPSLSDDDDGPSATVVQKQHPGARTQGLPFAQAPDRSAGLPFAPPARGSSPGSGPLRGGLPFVPAKVGVPQAGPAEEEERRPPSNKGRTVASPELAAAVREALPFVRSLADRFASPEPARPAPSRSDDSDSTAIIDTEALRRSRPEPEKRNYDADEDATTQHQLPPMPGRLGSPMSPMRLGAMTLAAKDPLGPEDTTQDLEGRETPGPAPPPPSASAATVTLAAPWLAAPEAPPVVGAALPFMAPAAVSPMDPPPVAPALVSQVPGAAAAPQAQPLFALGSSAPPWVPQPTSLGSSSAGWSAEPAPPPTSLGSSSVGWESAPRAAAVPEAAPAKPPPPARTDKEDLADYARVKAAAWRPGKKLGDLLREVGLDEVAWVDLEGRVQAKLADEAKEGGSRYAREVRKALRDANKSLDEAEK